jgi:hypothetical protein
MENANLDLFLLQMGILPKASDLEILEDVIDPRWECLQKGYYNDPRDENGEVPY